MANGTAWRVEPIGRYFSRADSERAANPMRERSLGGNVGDMNDTNRILRRTDGHN